MKVKGKRTYLIMGLIGIIGLLKSMGVMPDVLTADVFLGVESTLLGLGGMAMRAGSKNDANPRGIKK